MNTTKHQLSPHWVDFHCHLDLYPDHKAVIAECELARVATLAVTTTPKAWQRNCELALDSSFVRVGLGLHPQLVSEREDEVVLLERYLSSARYVGEIGLDAGPRFYQSFEAQERVFSRILQACAEQGNKILSIHSVRTAAKVLDHLEKSKILENCQAILHWFTGSSAEARRAVELGCYFSVNEEMLRSVKHRKLIASIPLNRLLTETDGPFVKNEGRAICPRDVYRAVHEIALLHGISEDATRFVVLSNLKKLVTMDCLK
ncbi:MULTISPECIES: Qat anti-phage system TatD family nuclease QatD [Enterobacterales]|uniref:Qat anti-phage system TatD family nuclease QatD n=1 Tax=Enterobacterales TaxID=91347 RepID=UPI000936B970|nr:MULTISPECIES: Qat anti-phage system TatD family nuclease QatD [Enterobacterales]HEJ8533883.1 TatD family hydrolase [Klebsiella oxytoca]MCX3396641.1 TatD family hydrolase [Citrobacter amalonaticus]MDQ2176079.1 Qat anti-phage system TatD family nuclease QatD [Citrobacter amalonaticus]UCQ28808.1 TatD family hydrolase [Edwardsiella tarda]HEJ8589120.1 TatD family hydrolase [Klebsiella oxytoca]